MKDVTVSGTSKICGNAWKPLEVFSLFNPYKRSRCKRSLVEQYTDKEKEKERSWERVKLTS